VTEASDAARAPEEDTAFPPDIRTDHPTSARTYDYCLGGKDNFQIDRDAVIMANEHFPGGVQSARDNRRFLYRLVRYLARDAGITQFLDMGSGLPTESNVHQVAQAFHPEARVVYVDNDPIVLAHGRAMLADEKTTTFLSADIADAEGILAHPDVRGWLDFSQPLAVLFVSIGHSITEDSAAKSMLDTVEAVLKPGDHLVFSQMVADDAAKAEQWNEMTARMGPSWRIRTLEQVRALMPASLQPVEPGWVDVVDWRPDPDQPALSEVDPPLRRFLNPDPAQRHVWEIGAVLRKG
jgi:hypothetical protein